jgi:3-deoxy-7-phosphoheptulonate synthase
MIIVLKREAPPETAQEILDKIASKGLKPLHMPGTERVVLGALGDERVLAELALDSHPMVESLKPILAPYKLVSREMHAHDTVVRLGKLAIGGRGFAVIAGPCAVETESQMRNTARFAKAAGAHGLRAGAYKPRTSPYAFQGHGLEGLKLLRSVGDEFGLPVVTEVLEAADVEVVAQYADALQIGARNMQNFSLLKAVGRAEKPVVLKRGMAAKVEDLLMAAEYLMAEGNGEVILCERGIRTFETATRNTLDLNAIPYIKQRTHLPVLVDPSHGTGVRDFVIPMALAAAACGADGILVEMHEDPAAAWSDGAQSLYPEGFEQLMAALEPIAPRWEGSSVSARRRRGSAKALTRRSTLRRPAGALRRLTDGARAPTPCCSRRSPGPSLILEQAALRIECRGGAVRAAALSAGGRTVLATLERALPTARRHATATS